MITNISTPPKFRTMAMFCREGKKCYKGKIKVETKKYFILLLKSAVTFSKKQHFIPNQPPSSINFSSIEVAEDYHVFYCRYIPIFLILLKSQSCRLTLYSISSSRTKMKTCVDKSCHKCTSPSLPTLLFFSPLIFFVDTLFFPLLTLPPFLLAPSTGGKK